MDGDEVEGIIEGFHEPELGGGCPIKIAVAVLKPDKWGRKRVVSGRGVTPEEAASRCFSEAMERHAAVFNEVREITWGSQASLGIAAIKPQSLILISEQQYSHASVWNSQVDADHRLPPRFDENQSIAWIKAQSLITQRIWLVPAACCYLGYPQAIEEGFPIPDSNGLASGDRLADAIYRALLEVIERDAVSIWWYGRVSRPALKFDRGKFPLWEPFEAWIRDSGRVFWLLDLTHDLGISVAAAVSCDERGDNLSFGFAAGRSKKSAALSAMGELVQFEATKRLQSRTHGTHLTGFLSWCMSAKLDDHRFILPSDAASRQEVPPSTHGVFSLDLLRDNKLDALAVDLGSEIRNANVVRVLVPGLRCIWPRFAPGRLYDVPHKLGWHERPLNETELNPIPILY